MKMMTDDHLMGFSGASALALMVSVAGFAMF